MRAREAEGIQIEVPGGCLRLGGSPGLDATLFLSVSYWFQRSRTRLLSVTGYGGITQIRCGAGSPPAWCRRDCGRGAGRACLQGEVPSLRGASA
jgi:hypothetical protein